MTVQGLSSCKIFFEWAKIHLEQNIKKGNKNLLADEEMVDKVFYDSFMIQIFTHNFFYLWIHMSNNRDAIGAACIPVSNWCCSYTNTLSPNLLYEPPWLLWHAAKGLESSRWWQTTIDFRVTGSTEWSRGSAEWKAHPWVWLGICCPVPLLPLFPVDPLIKA